MFVPPHHRQLASRRPTVLRLPQAAQAVRCRSLHPSHWPHHRANSSVFSLFHFNRLRTLLFSVGNSFACHSYENSRRGPQIFPLWNFAHASYYSLFALFTQRVFHNSFAIRRFRTLSRNCRVSPPSSHPRPHGMVAAKGTRIPPLTTRRILLYFHPLTNAPSRNSFPLTSLQMPGGMGVQGLVRTTMVTTEERRDSRPVSFLYFTSLFRCLPRF
jgi:hypothetical protein